MFRLRVFTHKRPAPDESVLVGVHLSTTDFKDPYETESRIKVAMKTGFLGRIRTAPEVTKFGPTTGILVRVLVLTCLMGLMGLIWSI